MPTTYERETCFQLIAPLWGLKFLIPWASCGKGNQSLKLPRNSRISSKKSLTAFLRRRKMSRWAAKDNIKARVNSLTDKSWRQNKTSLRNSVTVAHAQSRKKPLKKIGKLLQGSVVELNWSWSSIVLYLCHPRVILFKHTLFSQIWCISTRMPNRDTGPILRRVKNNLIFFN